MIRQCSPDHIIARATTSDVVTPTPVATSHRAGLAQADRVRMLVDHGVSDRVLRDGHEHEGIELRSGAMLDPPIRRCSLVPQPCG